LVAEFAVLRGLSKHEVDSLAARLGVEIPNEIRELLEFTSGLVSDRIGQIDFTGEFGLEEVFPVSVAILGDGCGNFWVVDVDQRTGAWGPVFFACHDPPAIVVQSDSLSGFLMQALADRERSALEDVMEVAGQNVSGHAVSALNVEQARQSSDHAIRAFAESLPDSFTIVDLRELKTGSGFSLWKPGHDDEVVRCEGELLWAIRFNRRKTLLKRLFGSSVYL
jgi:hypothetical protein